jgi:YggT family protein
MDFNLTSIVEWTFKIYTGFLLVRIIGSWFPSFAHTKLMQFVAFYTDPYLNLFRRIVPPIGGTLDISPILAFIGLQIMEKIILHFVH